MRIRPFKGQPVKDLTAADFEVFEDGAPQKVESFELVEVRAGGPQESRREPNTVREAQAMAEDARARIFVIYLDTYFTDIAGLASHPAIAGQPARPRRRRRRPVCGDDAGHVGTDLALARRSTTMEGYLSKYWFWGQRGRLYPEDPVEQRYLECYPERSQAPELRHARQQQRAGFGTRQLLRRHRQRDDSTAAREAGPRRVGRPVAAPGRVARRAQGRHHDLQRLAAVHAQPDLTRQSPCDRPPGVAGPARPRTGA